MRLTQLSLMFVSGFLLIACATFQPELGTPLSSWQGECKQRSWTSGQLIAAVDNVKAYTCQGGGGVSPGTVYIFQNDRLVQITTNTDLAALAHARARTAGQLGTNMLLIQQLGE